VSWGLLIFWCIALTLVAYGRALDLPFFFDDLVHLPHVDQYSFGELWQTAGNLTYYRPLPFAIWKILYELLGLHDPVVLHSFSIILHAVNGFLVGWLAGSLWSKNQSATDLRSSRWLRRFLSASLFLMYPFSYQAVPWIGSLAHILVTNLILLSLAFYWQMRDSNRPIWGALSLVTAFLAPFAHENGVLVGPLLAAIFFTRVNYRENATRTLRHVIIWTLPALIWLAIRWITSGSFSNSVAIGNVERLFQNSTYFLQGAAYPITWLSGWIRDATGANDIGVTVVLSAVVLLGALFIQKFNHADRRSALPWLWMVIAALPAILFLSFDYVINGPRLLMLVSVGAAWLWTDVAIQAAGWIYLTDGRYSLRKWLRAAFVAALCLLLLLQSYLFVQQRMSLHQLIGEAHNQVIDLTLISNEKGKSAIFVNAPTWVAPNNTTYALGHEGVQFLPNYAPPESLISVNRGRSAEIALLGNSAIRPEMPYKYGLAGANSSWHSLNEMKGDIYVAEYSPEAVAFRFVGVLRPDSSDIEPDYWFNEPEGSSQVALLSAKAVSGEEGVTVNLVWRVAQPPPEHVTVFVQVVDEHGLLIAQIDGDPLGGSYPLSQGLPGVIVEDRRVAALDEPGSHVLVGLYNRLTGQRFAALSSSGQEWSDSAVVIELER